VDAAPVAIDERRGEGLESVRRPQDAAGRGDQRANRRSGRRSSKACRARSCRRCGLAASPQPWFVFALLRSALQLRPPPPYDTRFDRTIRAPPQRWLHDGRLGQRVRPRHPGRIIRKISGRGSTTWWRSTGRDRLTDSQVGVVLHALDESSSRGRPSSSSCRTIASSSITAPRHRQTLHEVDPRAVGHAAARRFGRGSCPVPCRSPTCCRPCSTWSAFRRSRRYATTFVPLIHGQAEPVRRGLMERLVRMYEVTCRWMRARTCRSAR
jgi:hypothetical protein